MTGRAAAAGPAKSVNADMSMSAEARARMRHTEKDVYEYYDDMGPGKGNCTWGAGILAHLRPCTKEELGRKVSPAEVDAAFSRRVADAERAVRRNVSRQALNQAQFDALVSLTYNAGATGSRGTYELVDGGDFKGAAANIGKMTLVTVNGKKGVAKGLILRRAEESAPFRSVETAKK